TKAIKANAVAKICFMIVVRGSVSLPVRPAAIAISRFVLLSLLALLLLLTLLVLLQEFAIGINFDAPFLALFVYDGFVNSFALFRLLFDFLDLVGASFIFDCRLHRRGQIGHLDRLLVFLLGGKWRPSA